MKIVLNKSDVLDDWYTIIRAEHDGHTWLQPVRGGGFQYMCSERISDACVEGTAEEMIAIANAIKSRENVEFRRCEVRFEDDGVHFSSPRNSMEDGVTTIEEADEFAEQVLRELTP